MKPQTNHFNPQVGKLKREFRLSCIKKGQKQKWINGVLKNDWIYVFKYLDNNSFFGIEEFLNGDIKKLNHKEVQEILCS